MKSDSLSLLRERKQKSDVDRLFAEKMASGRFTNTGAQYTPEQARADASNPALRLTACAPSNARDCQWSK